MECQPEGPKRNASHEKRGRQTEPQIASRLVQPYGHPEQGKRGKKLVRHAEKIPENPPGRDGFAVDDQRRNAEDDERKNERQRRRGRRPRPPLPSGQLHQDIPCQPRAGVERVEDKSGEAQQRELESNLRTDQPERRLFDKARDAAGENGIRLPRRTGQNHHGSQTQAGEKSLEQHSAVSNRRGVHFAIELLGSGAAGHDAVEAGARTAGHGDKKNRQHRSRDTGSGRRTEEHAPRHDGRGEHIEGSRQATDDDSGQAGDENEVKEVAAEIAPRLQKQPQRRHRGEKAVGDQNVTPKPLRIASGPSRKIERRQRADPDRGKDEWQKHELRLQGGHPGEAQGETHEQGKEQINHRRSGHRRSRCRGTRRGRRLDESSRRHVGESDKHVDERDPDEEQEQDKGAPVHV